MPIVLAGATSGSATLQATDATTVTVTMPATSGTLVTTGGAQTIEFADGSASAPSITNSGDTNTGMFFPAADTIAFTEGGVESMRVTSAGSLGIGTNSPVSRLEVKNTADNTALTVTSSFEASLQLVNGGGSEVSVVNAGGSNIMSLRTGNTERMRITNGGDVLVNTTGLSFGGKLQVFDTGSRAASFQTTANDQALLTRCSLAGFSNTVQYMTVDRSANSGFNFAQMVGSGTGDNEFVFRGDGNGYADGTWNNNGADYAEYFESATGQVIPTGSTVVLENNKVRLATVTDNPDDIIGVVRPKEPSKASMVVGNTAWNKWANKYLTDDFDRYIMEDHNVLEWTDEDGKQHSYESHNVPEDVVVPQDAIVKTHDDKGNKFEHYKLNPAWDKDSEYVNRENRDEWLIIGLIGQVKVLKGQVMGDRWKKMRDVSASVEEWMIR